MTKRTTTQVGDKVIRTKARRVKFPLSKDDKRTIKDLIDTMHAGGTLVAMAAPQIGDSKQIFVSHPRSTKYRKIEGETLHVFVNPKIMRYSRKKDTGYEACGSVAESNLFGEVKRAHSVDVEWQDEDGKKQKGTFSGFLARIIQHETDHLHGIVFADKLHTTRTLMSGSEFKKKIRK